MKRTTLIRLHLLYALVGISYNLLSIGLVQQGSTALSPTSPKSGIIALTAYALSLLSCRLSSPVPYRILMGLWVLVFGYGGVALHAINVSSLDRYHSIFSWAAAIGINAFGLMLNACAAVGLFRPDV